MSKAEAQTTPTKATYQQRALALLISAMDIHKLAMAERISAAAALLHSDETEDPERLAELYKQLLERGDPLVIGV